MLPPAIVLLVIFTLPVPRRVNGWLVQIGDLIFNLRIGTLSVFAIATFVSFVALLAQGLTLYRKFHAPSANVIERDAIAKGEYGFAAEMQQKATRWREERNFWIAAFTFVVYWMIYRFHALMKQLSTNGGANPQGARPNAAANAAQARLHQD